jgi:phage terminase small subunit
MAPLTNPRHERFALALFEGKSADEAYVTAGYRENRGNASRLKANECIQTRLAELQQAVAKEQKVTVASLLRELEEAREHATTKDQLSAAVRATMGKAQIAGLLVEHSQVEITGTVSFADCRSHAEIAERLLHDHFREKGPAFQALITPDDVARGARFFDQLDALLEEIKARAPKVTVIPPSRPAVGISQYQLEQRRPNSR